MSASVFVGDHILMDVSFDTAVCQLGRLAVDGVLLGAAEYAYGTGITGLTEAAGVAGDLSRLAGVEAAEVTETAGCARVALRWEAIGANGALFPALDADLTLTPAGERITLLALAGVYRLPDQIGTGLDAPMVRCFAAVTIRGFVARLACAVMHPAGTGLLRGLVGQDSPLPPPGREMP
jgi:hypothetical protein